MQRILALRQTIFLTTIAVACFLFPCSLRSRFLVSIISFIKKDSLLVATANKLINGILSRNIIPAKVIFANELTPIHSWLRIENFLHIFKKRKSDLFFLAFDNAYVMGVS